MSAFEVNKITSMAWDGAIPVRCSLSLANRPPITMKEEDLQCFFMVPRLSYLSLCSKVALEKFGQLENPPFDVQSRQDYMHFSYSVKQKSQLSTLLQSEDEAVIPVPWHYPMGVILDFLASKSRNSEDPVTKRTGDPCALLSGGALPLTVHFTPPPDERGVPSPQPFSVRIDQLERLCLQQVSQMQKMATMMVYGSTKPILTLEPSIMRRLTEAVRTYDVNSFFQGRAGLEKNAGNANAVSAAASSPSQDDRSGLVAVMLHVDGRCLPYTAEVSGGMRTLGHLLRKVIFVCSNLSDEQCQASETLTPKIAVIKILGTSPALCTPLLWLREHLCCADLFVHVVVTPICKEPPRPLPKLVVAPGEPENESADGSTSARASFVGGANPLLAVSNLTASGGGSDIVPVSPPKDQILAGQEADAVRTPTAPAPEPPRDDNDANGGQEQGGDGEPPKRKIDVETTKRKIEDGDI